MKILIVEDEALYADKVEMLIEKLGYTHLKTVDNSIDALKIVLENKPDLIIMDVNIKGKYDGIELTEIINNNYELSIPILFVTSLQDDATFKRALKTGTTSFLLKPFNEIQLKRNIQLVLNQNHDILAIDDETTADNSTKIFEHSFFVKINNNLEKIFVDDILFLKADGHYCQIQTSTKKILFRSSLINLIRKFKEGIFIQTHRSFFVNFKKMSSINLSEGTIDFGSHQASIGSKYKDIIKQQLDLLL